MKTAGVEVTVFSPTHVRLIQARPTGLTYELDLSGSGAEIALALTRERDAALQALSLARDALDEVGGRDNTCAQCGMTWFRCDGRQFPACSGSTARTALAAIDKLIPREGR